MSEPKTVPAKSDIAMLEPFDGLGLRDIHVIEDARQAEYAVEVLMAEREVGFDTESKPTFHKGQKSTGPHVLQFSTTSRAFIFQSHVEASHPAIVSLLSSDKLLKIGFGLGGDLTQISKRFGLRPGAIVDIDRTFRQLGYRNAVGAKSAIAMLFGRKLQKSKSLSTSNWSATQLSEAQLIYAANDAYAAILVYHALRDARS